MYDDGGGGGGGGGVRLSYPPLTPMVRRIILANVVVFVVFVMLGFGSALQQSAVEYFGVTPALWSGWFPFVPVWQLFTYGFLHAPTGLSHIFFNMLTLYFLGGMVEQTIGARRFGVHYLLALAFGGLAHVLVMPLFGLDNPAIGASGACLAMTVAAATLAPHRTILLLVFPVKLMWAAIAIVAINAFQVVLQLQGSQMGQEAVYIHLAGALYGYLAVKRRWIFWDPISSFERRRAATAVARHVSDDSRMDQLLARIKREGLGSLSKSDREFLARQSERGR